MGFFVVPIGGRSQLRIAMASPTDRITRLRVDPTAGQWRWRSLLEMGVLLAAVIGLNLALDPFDPAYVGVRPHPYLVGVALIASYYGVREGLGAAAMAVAALVLQLVAQRGLPLGHVVADRAVQLHAAWLMGAGYVLGVIRRFGVEQLRDAVSQLTQARRHLSMLEEQHAALKAAKDELEQRIIGQTASVHSLYESVKALESLDLPQVHQGLVRVVASFTGAQQCSLFLADADGRTLRLADTYGWERPVLELIVPADRGLPGIAIRERRVATVSEIARSGKLDAVTGAPDAAGAEHPSLLCAPLFVGGRLYGVINVEQIAFQRLTLSTVRMLGMLVDLASPAIDNAVAHQAASAERVTDPHTQLLRPAYGMKRLGEECLRAQRYKLPLCAMVAEWDGWTALLQQPPERREPVIRDLCQAMRAHLRSVDLIAHDELADRFVIVLPLTDLAGALVVAQRVQQALEAVIAARAPGQRWMVSVTALRDSEDATALRRRLHEGLDQAKTRQVKRPIVLADSP
jgi:GGDEF domain-containing protein